MNGSLSTWDLTDNSILGRDVLDDTLTGADIFEGTLSQVPSASFSSFASSVGSNSVGPSQLAPNPAWRYIGDAGQPAFQNGWTNYDGATNHVQASWQHAASTGTISEVVHLGGLVKGGTIGQTIFTLP